MSTKDLISVAQTAKTKAYANYSNFKVGAALETQDGVIYSGCNVENASYSLTLCAERNVLSTAIAAGEREFKQMVIASDNGVTPCGACRQVIWELCGDIPITLVDAHGNLTQTTSRELLPAAFGQDDLIKAQQSQDLR